MPPSALATEGRAKMKGIQMETLENTLSLGDFYGLAMIGGDPECKWLIAPKSLSFSQGMVDDFVKGTGDENRIHRSVSESPVVPGMLLVSSFPLFFSGFPVTKPGYVAVMQRISDVQFMRFVKVGTELSLEYTLLPEKEHDRSIEVPCDFRLIVSTKNDDIVVAKASFSTVLMPERLYRIALRTAL